MTQDDGFLSRWSRRKSLVREGLAVPEAPPPEAAPLPAAVAVPEVEAEAETAPAAESAPAPPPPTLDDVAALTLDADFARFVAPEVSGEVRNAALKKLFSDPHFNVMDGLDTYIDDYNTPDPLPRSMLAKMAQAAYLGLVDEQPKTPNDRVADKVSAAVPPAAAPAAAETPPHDEDPDLRLQSLDDPGPSGPEPGAGEDAGGQR